MAEGAPARSSSEGSLEAKTLTDVLIWLQKEGFPEHVLSAFEDQDMDGEAICVTLASTPGPDSLRDVIPKLELRLRVYQVIKSALDKQYSEQVFTCATSEMVNTAPTSVTHVSIQSPKPQNYLFLSIINLVFCCAVFGVIGCIYSLKVDSEWNSANYQGAHDAAHSARNWGIAGIVTGFLVIFSVVTVHIVVAVVVALA